MLPFFLPIVKSNLMKNRRSLEGEGRIEGAEERKKEEKKKKRKKIQENNSLLSNHHTMLPMSPFLGLWSLMRVS